MTQYAILLPGDEAAWAAASEEEQAATFALHDAFSRALAQRGHQVVGGAELAPSSEGRSVRSGADGPVVTDGPYTEAVEQMSGFYLVESDDLDDLVRIAAMLADERGGVEVRACLPPMEDR